MHLILESINYMSLSYSIIHTLLLLLENDWNNYIFQFEYKFYYIFEMRQPENMIWNQI